MAATDYGQDETEERHHSRLKRTGQPIKRHEPREFNKEGVPCDTFEAKFLMTEEGVEEEGMGSI